MSGVCARDGIICDIANELGMHILRKWEGLEYSKITVLKADIVKTLIKLFSCLPCVSGVEQEEIDASKLFCYLAAAYSQQTMEPWTIFKFVLMVYPTGPHPCSKME